METPIEAEIEKLNIDEQKFITPKTNTLLVIDDNEEIIRFFRDKFSHSYQVYTSTNADDGIKLAYTKIPDLIISDVVMPGKSGIDLVKALKMDMRTSTIPIILLTALDTEDQRTAGLRAMADAYITKPFNSTHLEAVIQNLITSRKELKERYSSELLTTTDQTSTLTETDRRFLNNLSAFVETHLANPQLNVEDICRAIGISRVQLYRKVRALLDCSVNDYITHRRLKKAKFLLLQEDMTINEIAYQTGFSSPTYFATLFKQHFGSSPSIFKKQLHQ